MSHKNHPFHLVDTSPWPILGAFGALTTTAGIIKWFHHFNQNLLILGFMITGLVMYQWWRDISRESTFQSLHTFPVTMGLRCVMIPFITSEVFLFISFNIYM